MSYENIAQVYARLVNTGSDALDVIVKDILPKMKRKQKRSENE